MRFLIYCCLHGGINMGFNMRYLDLKRKIRDGRMWAIQGITEAGSGHPGASFSAAEIMGTLYFRRMRYDPSNPDWSERDYFINSKAHSAPGFYSALAVAGYFQPEELRTLRQLGSRLQGHPVRYSEHQRHHSVPGIEYSGGSEGIGLSVGVGIALAQKLDGKKNRVFVLIGDGESNEGQIWEASMAAGKFKLDNIVTILDRNRIQQDGFTEDIMPLDPIKDKWTAFNWEVFEVDGHRVEQIVDALNKAGQVHDKPVMIIANTVKGNGIRHMANNPQWHGKAPPKRQTEVLLEELESECLIAPSIIAGERENYEDKIRKVRSEQIVDALNKAGQVHDKPVMIIANTVKGNGIRHMANNPQWHGKAPPKRQTEVLLEELESECLIAPSIIAGERENYEDKIRKVEQIGRASCRER